LGRILVDAQQPHPLKPLHFVFAADDYAAAVDRGYDFHRIEAEPGDIAEAPDLATPVLGAKCVACVLEDSKTVFLRQPVNAVQVARDTGEMQGVNRFRASCN